MGSSVLLPFVTTLRTKRTKGPNPNPFSLLTYSLLFHWARGKPGLLVLVCEVSEAEVSGVQGLVSRVGGDEHERAGASRRLSGPCTSGGSLSTGLDRCGEAALALGSIEGTFAAGGKGQEAMGHTDPK